MLQDFKKFATKGNVVDLAVAVIIGGAFGKIIASFVGDVLMPLIGALLGGVDLTGLAVAVGSATLAYGKFLQACLDFLIVAATIFAALQLVERARRKAPGAPAPAPAPARSEALLEEIRDLLKAAR